MNAPMRFAIIHARFLSPMTANAGKCAFLPVWSISKNRSRPGVESGRIGEQVREGAGRRNHPGKNPPRSDPAPGAECAHPKSGVKRFSRDAWTTP